jgi:hypothetical protein
MVIRSQINGAFTGWSGATLFHLTNGQFWAQSRYAYFYHYLYRPIVTIEPVAGRYIMTVDAIGQSVEVVPVNVQQCQVNGAFKGWVGNTEVELTNGQVWKQQQYLYHYEYSYRPQAVIYSAGGGWVMSVNGGPPVSVKRIK